MYLPRAQLSNLYATLLTTHSASQPPLLILTALNVDALCATRILTSLLRRDFIPHTVVPVSGYGELAEAGERLVQPLLRQRGGDGGRVVCIGCGGGVDMSEVLLGLDGSQDVDEESGSGHGVEVWLVDMQRPWNLENLFSGSGRGNGVRQGKVLESYQSGRGGVIAWCDNDIEAELDAEREAYFALRDMPEMDESDLEALASGAEDADDRAAVGGDEDAADDEEPSSSQTKRKRRSSESDGEDSDADMGTDDDRPRQRRRSNSGTPIPSSPGGNPISNQLATSLSPSSQSANGIVPSSPPAVPTKAPSLREQKRALFTLRRKHEATLERYYDAGSWSSEPVSSMLYSLAADLGREDNELLWLAIVGVESVALSPLTAGGDDPSDRPGVQHGHARVGGGIIEMVKSVLGDEVRRLNPPSLLDGRTQTSEADNGGAIPTHARSPTDQSIRLSPEPRFLLIRHWSLYDSMLHSPYLATRLHVWNEAGRKRLHKLLAKMGISLAEAGKGYLHLDMEIKRSLNKRLGKFAEMYGLEGLVPSDAGDGAVTVGGKEGWGFVKSWGWRGTLSAVDVATVVSAILEVGPANGSMDFAHSSLGRWDNKGNPNYNARVAHGQQRQAGLPSPPHSSDSGLDDSDRGGNGSEAPDWSTRRFFAAFDALAPSSSSTTASGAGLATLLNSIPIAQDLARAILRTGSALISKKQIRHLRAFRMGVVREGPDVPTFTHPGALVKLGGWVREAVCILEAEKGHKAGGAKQGKHGGEGDALVLAALDEGRGVYVVVGLGGGSGLGKRVKSKAEIKEREEKAKRKSAAKLAKKAEKSRKRAEARALRRERLAANGDVDSEDSDAESDATESDASSSSGNSDASSDDSQDEAGSDDERGQIKRRRRGPARNRFGQAFQEVVEETGARVRIDSFEHSVVEVRKEDLAGFLEGLSLKSVVGS